MPRVSQIGIPRLYAAASLKRDPRAVPRSPPGRGIPRLYAAASLKRARRSTSPGPTPGVFRGFMPRPH